MFLMYVSLSSVKGINRLISKGMSNIYLKVTNDKNYSRSHYYAQLENALQKHFFAYSALIMDTLKKSTGRFFNFSAQSQNFTGGSARPNLP